MAPCRGVGGYNPPSPPRLKKTFVLKSWAKTHNNLLKLVKILLNRLKIVFLKLGLFKMGISKTRHIQNAAFLELAFVKYDIL